MIHGCWSKNLVQLRPCEVRAFQAINAKTCQQQKRPLFDSQIQSLNEPGYRMMVVCWSLQKGMASRQGTDAVAARAVPVS